MPTVTRIVKFTVPHRHDLIGNWNRTYAIEKLALQWCKGHGVDYGYGDNVSWPDGVEHVLPGAVGVDLGVVKFPDGRTVRDPNVNANNLGLFHVGSQKRLDYVFSSHALEHIADWQPVLRAWCEALSCGGVLFLYLPHVSVPGWLPSAYHEHKWAPTWEVVSQTLHHFGMTVEEVHDGYDAEGSFYVIARKTT